MTRSFIFLTILALTPTLSFGQGAGLVKPPAAAQSAPKAQSAPPASKGESNSSSASLVNSNGGLLESSTSEKFADRIFDTNNDSVDWDNGSINWKGKTYNIGNSRVVRSRFERYLSTDMSTQGVDEYKDIMNEILAVLSTRNTDLNLTSLKYAWNLLFDAGEFPYDGNASTTIANTIDTSWRIKGERRDLKYTESLDQKDRDKAITKAISLSNYLDTHGISSGGASQTQSKGGKGEKGGGGSSEPVASSSTSTAATPLHGKADLMYATKSLATKEKDLVKLQTTTAALDAKVVIQFQTMVVGFLTARRFSHAIIACDFYREIFKGSKQDFQVGKKELADMIPISNIIPSADTIQTIAFEGKNDVILGMQAVHALYDKGERYSALQRLMETFFLGENETDVMSFPYDKKQVLYSIYRDASTIKDLADSRDLAGIEEKIKNIEKSANDFPVSEIMAKVNAAKRASDLKVFAAKQSALLGDIEGVERNVTDATMIWPLNPSIEEFNTELMEMASGSTLYTQNFNKLLENKNYREIAKDAVEYAMVFRNEPKKLQEIKEIVTKVGSIDMLIAQSDEFQKQNNHYFAWELLENALLIDKDDVVLARAISALSPMVADYVKLTNAAKLAEQNKSFPEALINYLRAKQISPTSQTCRLAIDRLSKRYLEGN